MKRLTKEQMSELAALRTEYNAAIQFAGERNDVGAAVTWLERELLATRRTWPIESILAPALPNGEHRCR